MKALFWLHCSIDYTYALVVAVWVCRYHFRVFWYFGYFVFYFCPTYSGIL